MWQQWVNLLLGLWIVALPFVGFTADSVAGLMVLTGIIVAALALWGALYEQSEMHRIEMRGMTG